jgi:hypothetical protein
MDRSGDYLVIDRIGVSGVLLLAAAGMVACLCGAHLVLAPRSAARRLRRPRLQGRP